MSCSERAIIEGLHVRVEHWEDIHRRAIAVIAEKCPSIVSGDGAGGLVAAVSRLCDLANYPRSAIHPWAGTSGASD